MSDLFTPEQAKRAHPILAFFARRPVTVTVLLVATTVIGVISLELMPIELFPAGFEPKSLSVEVSYNKAGDTVSPLTIEREVTLPVEAELSTIPGVQDLSAVSRQDEADFDIQFDGDRDMDEAYAEVMAAVERARLRLPDDVGQIRVRRFRGSSGGWPIAFVNFSWEDGTVDPYLKLERVIQPALESIDGIASVTFFGTHRKYIAVDLDPEKTRAYGVNLAELLQRLRGDNFRAPAGKATINETLIGDGGVVQEREVYLVADSRFRSLEEIENLPVRAGLRIADITRHGSSDGQPHNGVYETVGISSYVRVDGKWGATAMIFKTGEANTVQVGDKLTEGLEELGKRPDLEGFSIRVPWNQGDSIKGSIADLLETLAWGGLLAFFVLLLFLKSWRLALVISLSIPLSMTLTLAVMFFWGETINLLALMGFTLAAGMLLDNSIVVAENVYRRNSMGELPEAAVARGAGEVGLALILATSTTVIVFVSVIFLAEQEFISFLMGKIGLPVCVSLAFSIVLALGVIPMTMQRAGLLKKEKTSRARRWFVRQRRVLRVAWRRGGPARLQAAPALVLWEGAALFAGRNDTGIPATPLMDRLSRIYVRVVGWLMPYRYALIPLMLVVSYALLSVSQSATERTDQNQGNRDRISMRVGFPGSSDILIKKRALQITEIEEGSRAAKAGLRVGDFILGYNSRPVDSMEELQRLAEMVPKGAPIITDIARGSRTGPLEIEGGELGVSGSMEDTQPLRDEIWKKYVLEVEDILLGVEGAKDKRDRAIEQLGINEEKALALYGRTPEEAKEEFGIASLSTSFSGSRARFWLYLEKDRVSEAGELYNRISAAMPERAGVDVSGQFEGGSSSTSEVSVRIAGPDTERLLLLAEEVVVRLEGVPGLEGVRVDTEEGLDEVTVGVDRQRAAAFGVEPSMLSQVLGFQLSGTTLRDYQRGENLLPLRVRFAPPEDARGNARDPNLDDVSETRIFTNAGGTVATKAVTQSTGFAKSGLGEVRRRNRQTSLRVVGTTSTEDLDRIRDQVNAAMKDVKFPPGYSQELGGRFGDFESIFSDLFKSAMWAGLLVFLLMCFLFESFLKPICILMASIPGAILGGYAFLAITDTPIDQIAFLGLIVLVGVVVNNGIVLVDLINRLRASGMERPKAIIEASRLRMRPIVLTSLTTAFGLIPMAVGDADFVGTPYYPLGRMVLGGILLSMLYTLLFVPLLYTILDDFGLAAKSWRTVVFGRKSKVQGGGEPSPAPASAE